MGLRVHLLKTVGKLRLITVGGAKGLDGKTWELYHIIDFKEWHVAASTVVTPDDIFEESDSEPDRSLHSTETSAISAVPVGGICWPAPIGIRKRRTAAMGNMQRTTGNHTRATTS